MSNENALIEAVKGIFEILKRIADRLEVIEAKMKRPGDGHSDKYRTYNRVRFCYRWSAFARLYYRNIMSNDLTIDKLRNALQYYARRDIYENKLMESFDGVPILADPEINKEGGMLARLVLTSEYSEYSDNAK